MKSGAYVTPQDIIFFAAANAGDTTNRIIPYGFLMAHLQRAWEELNMETSFIDGHADFNMPKNLSIPLPSDCFDVRNVYVFTGDACVIGRSRKVYPKRNYWTKGKGYLANDKGYNNPDPFFNSHNFLPQDKSLIRYNDISDINSILFYNVQNGVLMLSSSCVGAGNRVHIHYGSTGCDVGEAPIIPVYFKTAMEDYVSEGALRFRMANEPSNAKLWQALQQTYAIRLDKEGFNGSWHKAAQRARKMSTDERTSLSTYLNRGAWAQGR